MLLTFVVGFSACKSKGDKRSSPDVIEEKGSPDIDASAADKAPEDTNNLQLHKLRYDPTISYKIFK